MSVIPFERRADKGRRKSLVSGKEEREGKSY
jgi:hypothetical protein